MSHFQAISFALLASALTLQGCSGGTRNFETTVPGDGPESGTAGAMGATGGAGGARGGSSGRGGQAGDSVSTVTGGAAGQGGNVDASLGDRATDAPQPIADASLGTETGSDAADAGVIECTPDAKKCDGLNPQRCSSAGRWTPVADGPCPFLCTNGACAGSCPPSATQCLSPTMLQTCGSDGMWQTPAKTCVDQACVADSPPAACVGQCAPTANKCTADFQLQTCTTKGQWGAATACPSNKTCIGNACTGVCAPNSTPTQCNQATPQFCNATGQWENRGAGACSGSTPVCLGGQCVACNLGDKRCSNGSTQQVCNAQHAWVDVPCSGGTPVCVGSQCVACSLGDKRCSNSSTPQTCSSQNTWQDATACSGDTPVCTNGNCGCTNGLSRCKNGSTPEFCVGGSWIAGNACNGNTPVCIAGSCKECTGTEARCTDNFNILQTCDGNGNWISTSCPHTCGTGGHPHCNTPAQISGIVACGTDLTCGSGSEGCCASAGNFHCGACPSGEPQKTPFVICDGNNDCGPNLCCMVAGQYVTPTSKTYCAVDCGVSVQGASKYNTCDPDFPNCPAGKTCTPWKDAETVFHVCWPAN